MKKTLVSVIIPTCNEENTIDEVINEVKKLNFDLEIIIVINGSTDSTEQIARTHNVKVLLYDEPLGHDVGRAIGAKHSQGDILLFLDSDFIIPASHLLPFITDVYTKKTDIALNAYPKTITKQNTITSSAKTLLNNMLNRADLGSSSMTNIPHALSRKALEIIGEKSLAIPPIALAKAILNNLNIEKSGYIPLHKLNKKRKRNSSHPLIHLVMSDHLKAINFLYKQKKQQSKFQSSSFIEKALTIPPYHENLLGSLTPEYLHPPQIAALIFTSNNDKSLVTTIQKIRHEGIRKIIVIDLHSRDQTCSNAAKVGAEVFSIQQLNCPKIKGDFLIKLFKNHYFLILPILYTPPINDLPNMILPLLDGTYDITSMYCKNFHEANSMMYLGSVFLHHCLGQDKALLQFPWFSPFALTKEALQKIGLQNIANPFKIYTLAVINHLKIKSIKHQIPISMNFIKNSHNLEPLFIKNLSSSLAELIEQKGVEGFYKPSLRALKKI